MRILLIQSYSPHIEEVVFPLGLCYIATALINHGHEVTVYDPNVHIDPLGELKDIAQTSQPEIIGIGLRNIDNSSYWNFFSYLDTFFETVSLVRKEIPRGKILAGGPGFSIYARRIMERVEAIDYGIFAEGEVDRSPTGTGVSGRLAIHYRRGEITRGQPIVIESIIGSKFAGKVIEETTFGPYPAIIPEVQGEAHLVGRNELWINPNDTLKNGFILR